MGVGRTNNPEAEKALIYKTLKCYEELDELILVIDRKINNANSDEYKAGLTTTKNLIKDFLDKL